MLNISYKFMLTFAKDRCRLNNTIAYYFKENTSFCKQSNEQGGSQARLKERIRYPKLPHYSYGQHKRCSIPERRYVEVM